MYKRKELSQEQRITWLFHNFPGIKTNLETLLERLKNEDLDNFHFEGTKVFIPKYADEMLEVI